MYSNRCVMNVRVNPHSPQRTQAHLYTLSNVHSETKQNARGMAKTCPGSSGTNSQNINLLIPNKVPAALKCLHDRLFVASSAFHLRPSGMGVATSYQVRKPALRTLAHTHIFMWAFVQIVMEEHVRVEQN